MFTAQNDLNISELLSGLGLAQLAFHNISAADELRCCLGAHRDIWHRVDLTNYTVHGLAHSLNILSYFEQLGQIYIDDIYLPKKGWSDYEKLVFAMAALIHDVGMQYNSWAELPTADGKGYIWQKLQTPSPPLDENEVRKHHVDFGASLVAAEVFSQRAWVTPPGFCTGTATPLNLLFRAHAIAFAHSDGKCWEACKCPAETIYKSCPEPGNHAYRPRLLAGTLRLCDELDGHYARVASPDRLWAQTVPPLSRLHWLACYYVVNTVLRIENNVACVTLKWRVPKDASPQFVDQIRDLLAEMRERKILNTVKQIREMYEHSGDNYPLELRVEGLKEPPIPFVQPVTDQLVDLVANFRTQLSQAQPPAPSPCPRREECAAETIAIESRIEPPAPVRPLPSSVEDQLKEWFLGHRTLKHVELASGAHTDTYIHCRSLVSNQTLVRSLTDHLCEKYKTSGIRTIIAVGTSAIPLAVNLAFRLNASITFTFFNPPTTGSNQEIPKHYDVEVAPVVKIPHPGRLLVLDDVIASGKVARDLVSQIVRLGVPAADITHLSLFRLESQDIEPAKLEQVTYDSLCTINDVYYTETKEECDLCKRGDRPIPEWDV